MPKQISTTDTGVQKTKRAKTTEQVRESETRFKEAGGKVLPIRLQTEDQSILHELALSEPDETNTSIIRKALREYKKAKIKPPKEPKLKKETRMPIIIAVVNQKGGSGKSSLVMAIADDLASRGYKVIILDTDVQVTIKNWMARRMETNPDLPSPSLYVTAQRFTRASLLSDFNNADYIIIDGPGGRDAGVDMMTSCCIAASDLTIIPTNTSVLDLDQTRHTIELVKQRQALTDGMPLCRSIVSRAVTTKITYRDTLAFFQAFEITKLSRDMSSRTLFESLPTSGLSPIYSGDKRMVSETRAITDEVLSLFQE